MWNSAQENMTITWTPLMYATFMCRILSLSPDGLDSMGKKEETLDLRKGVAFKTYPYTMMFVTMIEKNQKWCILSFQGATFKV